MSKTLFFSGTVFFKNIKRFWPVWASYFVVWFIALPMNLMSAAGRRNVDNLTLSLSNTAAESAVELGIAFSFIFAVICAMTLFSYLYNSNSAGMLHALPLGRTCLYMTNLVSGLAFLLVPNLLIFAISAIIEGAYGAFDATGLLIWLYVVSATGFFFFCFAAFCAQFTGSTAALPIFYVIMNLIAEFFEYMARSVGELLLYGVCDCGNYMFTFLSPIYYMYEQLGISTSQNSPQLYSQLLPLWYALAGGALAALGLVIYHRRKVESAGDVVSVGWVRPVFRWGVAICASVGFSILMLVIFDLYGSPHLFFWLLAFMLIWGFAGWFAAEMLLKKSLKVFSGNMKGFAVFAAVIVAALFLTEFDVLGIEKRVPDIDNVDFVLMDSAMLSDKADIEKAEALHKDLITDKAALDGKSYANRYAPVDDNTFYTAVDMIYHLKDGGSLRRVYSIPVREEMKTDESSYAYRLNALTNSPEQRVQRLFGGSLAQDKLVAVTVDFPASSDYGTWTETTINGDDAWLITQALSQDVGEGNIGDGDVFAVNNKPYQNSIYVSFKRDTTADYETYSDYLASSETYTVSFQITEKSINLITAMKSLGLLDGQHQLVDFEK